MGNTSHKSDFILPGSRGGGLWTGMGRASSKKLLTSCFIHTIPQKEKRSKLLPCPHCLWLSRISDLSFSHPPPKEIKIVTSFHKEFHPMPQSRSRVWPSHPWIVLPSLLSTKREEQRNRKTYWSWPTTDYLSSVADKGSQGYTNSLCRGKRHTQKGVPEVVV